MKAKLVYVIWLWGLKEDAQMIQGMKDIKEVGFRYFESVATAVEMFKGRTKEFKAIMDEHQVYPVSFYFWNRGDSAKDAGRMPDAIKVMNHHGIMMM